MSDQHLFNILMMSNIRVHTKKAYMIYTKMRKRVRDVHKLTPSYFINCCIFKCLES